MMSTVGASSSSAEHDEEDGPSALSQIEVYLLYLAYV